MTRRHWLALVALISLALCSCQKPLVQVADPTSSAVSSATPLPTGTATRTSTVAPTATTTSTRTATPLPTATPAPTATPLELSVQPLAVRVEQGHTLAILTTANRDCRIEALFAQRAAPFVPAGESRQMAFVGVHALAEPGTAELTILALTSDGQRVEVDLPIEIVAGDYGHETLSFDPETSKLLDPSVTGPELERLSTVYGQYTENMDWQRPFHWPIEGVVTSQFGTRRQYGDAFASYHSGIDIDGETGDAIMACASGTVVMAEALDVRGNAVIIDHGAGVMSGYYHLSEIEVDVGQRAAQSEQIGRMGSTGLSTGSHLHWEVRVGGVPVSPGEWRQDGWLGPLSAEG